jgi:ubiquitin-conjugating enzyme E2 J1
MTTMSNSTDQPPPSLYNTRSTSVKRLMREAVEMKNPTELYYCQPIEDNLFEWHFTIRGPIATEFEQGIYHGRILFPVEYPMKPPSIILLTESGRFKTNEKICLSISGHHAETWTPTWGVRTALLAIIGFMETPGEGALGSLDYTPEERKILAKRSQAYLCPKCGMTNSQVLLPLSDKSIDAQKEAKELGIQINFVKKSEAKPEESSTPTDETNIESTSSSPSDPILEPQAPVPSVNSSHTETRPIINLSIPRQNESDNNLLSMFIFLCCMILSFLLLRRIFLTFGANRSYPPPSSDPFHDDF